MASRASPSGFSSTSARTTFIPSRAKRSAIARPMPLAAPVTTATFPFSSRIVGLRPVVYASASPIATASRRAVELLNHLLGGERVCRGAARVLHQLGALVVRDDPRRQQADLPQVRHEAAEHDVPELQEARRAKDELTPLGSRQGALELLLVDLVHHESVAHQQRHLEGPVLAFATFPVAQHLREMFP